MKKMEKRAIVSISVAVLAFVLWYEAAPRQFVPAETTLEDMDTCLLARDILREEQIRAYCVPDTFRQRPERAAQRGNA